MTPYLKKLINTHQETAGIFIRLRFFLNDVFLLHLISEILINVKFY